MPYLKHFGLYRSPFDLTPNRALFFPEQHNKVLSALRYAIQRGEGIVKVVGEVGTGKTMLLRLLLQSLVDKHEVAYITAPQSDPNVIATNVAREFNLDVPTGEDPYLVLAPFLMRLHAEGRAAVLLIDEAQALDRRGLETVRLLSNFETDDRKLLQIVLFGQPELDQLLRQYGMRQLAQRVTFNFTTHAFDRETAVRYVQHRIDCCTDQPTPHRIFAPPALRLLAKESRGIPRILNVLGDRSLLAAYAAGAGRVERAHVKAAVAEGILWPQPRSLWDRLFRRTG